MTGSASTRWTFGIVLEMRLKTGEGSGEGNAVGIEVIFSPCSALADFWNCAPVEAKLQFSRKLGLRNELLRPLALCFCPSQSFSGDGKRFHALDVCNSIGDEIEDRGGVWGGERGRGRGIIQFSPCSVQSLRISEIVLPSRRNGHFHAN